MSNISAVEYLYLTRLEEALNKCMEYPYHTVLGDDDLEAIEEMLRGVRASIKEFQTQEVK